MGLLKKLRGLVVINDVQDDTVEPVVEAQPPEQDKKEVVYKTPRKKNCCDKYSRVIGVLFLCLILGLLIPIIFMATVYAPEDKVLGSRGYCLINKTIQYSCGDLNQTENECQAIGCCFNDPENAPYLPSCYHSAPSEYGYTVLKSFAGETRKTPLRFIGSALELGKSQSLNFDLSSLRESTTFGDPAWPAQVKIERQGDDIIRLTLSSPGHEQGTFVVDDSFSPSASMNPNLDVQVSAQGETFNISVYRTDTHEVLFNTLYGPMIVGDGYIELTTTLPTAKIYGLGSRYSTKVSPSFEEFETWTLNSRDTSFSNKSLPGTHPFFMGIDSYGQAYGIHVRTSAPLQIGAVPAPGLSFRSVIGTFKILIMAGPTPLEVSKQYTDMVRRPHLPPYWALGLHLCRTVQSSLQNATFSNVTDAMEAIGLPYESDCLDARLAYPDTYAAPPAWVDDAVARLRKAERKFLGTAYPFVVHGSTTYNEAAGLDILLKLNSSYDYFGSVSKAAVGYPDYMNENSFTSWMNSSASVTSKFSTSDGVLLLQNSPLNEAAVRYTLSGNGKNCVPETPDLCCWRSGLGFQVDAEVTEPTEASVCWATIHPSLADSLHLAHRNAYGLHHSRRVRSVLQTLRPTSRPLLMSSSTHPGSGNVSGHFSEGFSTTLDDQKRALLQVLDMGLAGVALTGTPPCGSRDVFNTTAHEKEWKNLCLRSYQNSLFSPFLLSHYEINQRSTNPTDVFGNQIKPLMMLRYMFMPTLYTYFVEASDTGAPVLRHLFYEFPNDTMAQSIGDEYMLGSSLLVVPNFVNESNFGSTTHVPAYFPPGAWYDFFIGRLMSNSSNGTETTLATTSTDINVFIRGGKIVFLQGSLSEPIATAEQMRKLDYHIRAAVSSDGEASGTMYYDDGETLRTDKNYKATLLQASLSAAEQKLRVTPSDVPDTSGQYSDAQRHSSKIDTVDIFGLPEVSKVYSNDQEMSSFSQDSSTGALHIKGIDFDWTQGELTISWELKQ
ncbi:maltase-glucoamylase [Hyalella azteca]|uniref:Maltase-glucoamylase n=1 Tax=Hyalella azteca TaxID=294128 RepID=A0A8B7P3D9_HYAAZ|nr:maltase-glucoamylase [Hyalella azteca]